VVEILDVKADELLEEENARVTGSRLLDQQIATEF